MTVVLVDPRRPSLVPVEAFDLLTGRVIPDPGPNDVMVRIQACWVCHTDLTYRDGVNDDFPFLLGHEAAGIVESAGTAVTCGDR